MNWFWTRSFRGMSSDSETVFCACCVYDSSQLAYQKCQLENVGFCLISKWIIHFLNKYKNDNTG